MQRIPIVDLVHNDRPIEVALEGGPKPLTPKNEEKFAKISKFCTFEIIYTSHNFKKKLSFFKNSGA